MYFPYLRGKLYELVAVRELIQENLIQSSYISPIIEPVRDNGTFNSLIKVADENKYVLNIISNPQVGEYSDLDKLKSIIDSNEYLRNSVIVLENQKDGFNKGDLLFYTSPVKGPDCDDIQTINVTPYDLDYNAIIRPKQPRVVFTDSFDKKDRNADYLKYPDVNFSNYHKLYKSAGFYGYGDYSIIGEDYSDSGFAPFAVAIHIVYFDDNNALRLKHFVSKSNDDMYNPANKLHEALEEMDKWYSSADFDKDKNDSVGLQELENLYLHDKYSGLGYLKKLELMHHFEIMNRYLMKKE